MSYPYKSKSNTKTTVIINFHDMTKVYIINIMVFASMIYTIECMICIYANYRSIYIRRY